MVSHEVLKIVAYEEQRLDRPYGLIEPDEVDKFKVMHMDECEFRLLDQTFDELCAKTGQGYADYKDSTIRLDVRHEIGSTWVRSISLLQGIIEDVEHWRCVSRIDNYDQDLHLLTVHHYTTDNDGFISEPRIGSPDIKPGQYQDLRVHFDVVEEAVPLPPKLSQIA